MSELIKADNEYKDWITNLSHEYKKSQIRAAVKVNEEMLRFYWTLGQGISLLSEKYGYGSGFYKMVSEDLKDIFPDVKSFSPTNLKYMRYFYEMYPCAPNRPQAVDDLVAEDKCPQVVDDLTVIYRIPWGHNRTIIDKCKNSTDKALFYVRKTLENNWSRDVLLNFLDSDLYERQGKAITNFSNTLPEEQSDLAQAITKDPYNFDFLTLREKYDEKELKDALIEKVNNFLMELGTGFAYMGREVRIEVGETEKFIDMLFYNTQRHCYVVVEIKTGKFDSSYAGQLGTYVVAVNHQMKTEDDNPTLGLLICKDMDKVEAQYALESTSQPLGISSYELSKLVPEEFKGSMPTIEEIEAELKE
jgi:predicted nuclease of restriction endonuclease-like (RecB) superfamily